MDVILWLLLFPSLLCFGSIRAFDLHLDGAVESNFFFQQSHGSSQQPLLKFSQHSILNNESRPLLKERLAILGPSTHPGGSVRVVYGPFEAKQSLPMKHLSLNLDTNNLTTPQPDHAVQMDITAHVVNTELRRESPVLRVLFHSGKHFHHSPTEEEDDKEEEPRLMEICIALKVNNPSISTGALTATCSPKGLDGVCIASLTLPFDWWTSSPVSSPTFPSLQQPPATAKPSKAVRNAIDLSYSVYETKAGQCTGPLNKKSSAMTNNFPPSSAILVQSVRPIGAVRLLPNVYAPRDLLVHEEAVSLSPTLRFIASAAPLYSHSHFYVTVLLDSTSAREEPYAVVVRAKVKHGLKIISIQSNNPAWSTSFDVNGKHIAAAVTAVRNFTVTTPNSHQSQELFTWLLAVNLDHHKDSSETGTDGGVRALWSWAIRSHSTSSPSVPQTPHQHHHHSGSGVKDGLDEVKGKLTSRFEVLKDEVQSVFPIIKRRDLVNTAILTSRQVSEPLRVFMVTQAGKLADVTLQASCSSADESVLKVSSSCTSVFLDGSEVRGSTNATFIARYGNVETTSSLIVWMPELPLDVQVNDAKLNQISGWKVPTASSNGGGPCRLRYQQTSFEVFARFYAEDHDSGRVSYLISRKTYLLVTDLVRKVIRVSDPRIAVLRSSSSGTLYVEGLKSGKTELQILSPMSGNVIAARELRVAVDKVDVTGISVLPIAGLSLTLTPDPDLESCFIAQVDAQERLHSKYQEAILDVTVHFSDGQSLPLRLTDRSHYALTVESHNASTLALTSPVRATIPRVLALNEGSASLTVALSSCLPCQNPDPDSPVSHPLAVARVQVHVTMMGLFNGSPVQNDARTESRQSYPLPSNSNQIIAESKRSNHNNKMSGRGDSTQQAGQGQLTFSEPGSAEFSSIGENQLSLKDDSNAIVMTSGRGLDPSFVSFPHAGGGSQFGGISSNGSHWHVSPLEIGMYVLLAVFCAAIAIFVSTCIVYASRARKAGPPGFDPPPASPSPAATEPGVNRRRNLSHSFWNRWRNSRSKDLGNEPEVGEYGGEPEEEEEERTDKEWIWLGRSTLDTAEESTVVAPVGKVNVEEPQQENCKDSKRMSGISYCGSEISVRIISRQDGREGYSAQLCFDVQPETAFDSKTFTKTSNSSTPSCPVRITTNQLAEEPALLLARVVRRPKQNRRGEVVSESDQQQQDTRRYARSWLMAGEAFPRDFNSNPSNATLEEGLEEPTIEREESVMQSAAEQENDQQQSEIGYNLATFLRHGSPDIKQANIVENPVTRLSANSVSASSDVDRENNSVEEHEGNLCPDISNTSCASNNQLALDYDRIISYLGILKETST